MPVSPTTTVVTSCHRFLFILPKLALHLARLGKKNVRLFLIQNFAGSR